MSDESPDADISLPPQSPPWVTRLTCVACAGLFAAINMSSSGNPTWDDFARFGVSPVPEIWAGQYLSLIASAFVHVQIWHIALNLYWLWTLGTIFERTLGSIATAAFYPSAAFVSSTAELVFGDSTGIGASGFVYAIFGFMWMAGPRFPQFAQAVNQQVVILFIVWLFVCLWATRVDLFPVGNAAHFAGLVFGALLGMAARWPHLRVPFAAIAGGLIIASIACLSWCPWSLGWLRHKAYESHLAKRHDEAFDFYSRIIERDPNDAWAHLNRSGVLQELGRIDEAATDQEKALRLDPSLKKELGK